MPSDLQDRRGCSRRLRVLMRLMAIGAFWLREVEGVAQALGMVLMHLMALGAF